CATWAAAVDFDHW
nr:immunoglobulin heavy chain junction region [Macaca mulatta]MOV38023.1 immunoglobulin heavy chain junction region [Macaca mulatta]MOV38085.1 immunoglobulin heavy chain junction region [Macaca mulatta]MOV38330.1 immunoglobulin heavy chain junction region [Macaca mulatta]MOV38529.1 immunoglobulin heavy chain junction region [Macaca mulatta]